MAQRSCATDGTFARERKSARGLAQSKSFAEFAVRQRLVKPPVKAGVKAENKGCQAWSRVKISLCLMPVSIASSRSAESFNLRIVLLCSMLIVKTDGPP